MSMNWGFSREHSWDSEPSNPKIDKRLLTFIGMCITVTMPDILRSTFSKYLGNSRFNEPKD